MSGDGTQENKTDGRDKGGRQKLIDAAIKLFGERGFGSVRAREVAAEAGVTHGLIRHHFGSMDGLRREVDAHIGSLLGELLAEVSTEDMTDFVGELMAAAEATYADPDAAEQRWAYVRRSLIETSDLSKSLLDNYAEYYEQIVARRAASGRVRDDLDPTWQALLHMFLDMGTMLLAPFISRRYGLRLADQGTMRQRNRFIREVVENGILKR